MRKFKFEKLVRDNIVSDMVRLGAQPKTRKLNKNEHVKELLRKLIEESKEVLSMDGDVVSEEFFKEVGDLYDIIETPIKVLNLDVNKVEELQRAKTNKWGSFLNGDYVEFIEVDDNYPKIPYYLENSDRYPELTK
ncbi:MAG: hypothetical protein Q9M91_08415 [Candidatus Dojkabacteria bacterium]|nr:hypothetical protein [Candidatus Dojkabacteria bacterium]MDQ7021797.1 hypothetical protein [Candidatus Dojkabacteria bacterium]